MRPGREVDARIAKEVFGYKVWSQAKVLYENAPKGDRPLRAYSKEIEWAWEVATHMHITLLPIVGGEWFAFVGPLEKQGWESPQALLQFLDAKQFNDCGAAAGKDAAAVICEAALRAVEKRQSLEKAPTDTIESQPLATETKPGEEAAEKPANVVSIH